LQKAIRLIASVLLNLLSINQPMKTLQHTWKFILILIIFSWSCEIEDDHGTLEFVLFNDDLMSIYGEPLGNYSTHENFIVNEQSMEVYLINCGGMICDPYIITSLNYESGSARKIYESPDLQLNIILTDFIQSTNTLYFWENNYLGQHFIAFDVNKLKYKIIQSGYGDVAVSPDFVFLNYEYDSLFIKKIDRSGNEEILGIRGIVTLASQDSPELLIQNVATSQYLIYNYETAETVLTKPIDYNIQRFYRWKGDDLFCAVDYPAGIKNFITDEILFSPNSSNQFLINFNTESKKIICYEEKVIGNSIQYQYRNIQLQVKDFVSGATDIPVNINTYNEYIGMAQMLDDGKTIIYTLNEKFYKATIQ